MAEKYRSLRTAVGGLALTTGLISVSHAESTTYAASHNPDTSCGVQGRPHTPEEFFCKDRRKGKLAVVVLPNLYTDKPFISYNLPEIREVSTYATDVLRKISYGKVDLIPTIVFASSKAEQTIEAIEQKYGEEGRCVDVNDDKDVNKQYMGSIIKETMPGIKNYSEIVAFGGDACATLDWDLYGVTGYEDTWRYVDVYNSDSKGKFIKYKGFTNITKLGSTMAHELEHDLGFGHAGTISLFKETVIDNPSLPVNLGAALKRRDFVYVEYGEKGNIMSNEVYPLSKEGDYKPEDLTNPLQEEFFNKYGNQTKTEYKKVVEHLSPSQEFTLKKDAKDEPKAVTVDLSASPVVVEGKKFTQVCLEPNYEDGKVGLNTYLSTDPLHPLLVTAKVGEFALSAEPREFITETAKVIVQQKGDSITFKVT